MVAAGVRGAGSAGATLSPAGADRVQGGGGRVRTLVVTEVKSTADAMRRLRKMGIWLVGLDAGGERSLFGCDLLKEPVAIVVGAEGKGHDPSGVGPGGLTVTSRFIPTSRA